MKELDILSCPLRGMHTISAGAGTGKTFAISRLFLRLVLENQLSVDAILVVTFTQAATEELRHRIRMVLKTALDIAENILRPDDGIPETSILTIVENCVQKSGREPTARLLRNALYSFDEASIYTIHSLCQRVLKDFAFETNMRYDADLVTDQNPFIADALYTFWRIQFYDAPAFLVTYARNKGWSVEYLSSLIKSHLLHPDITIIPQMTQPDFSEAERNFRETLDGVVLLWQRTRDEISKLMLATDSLHKAKYKTHKITAGISAFDALAAEGTADPELFDDFILFTKSYIRQSTNKNKQSPDHPFFDRCQTLHGASQKFCNALDTHLLWLRTSLFSFVRDFLAHIKLRDNCYFFDDLLIYLYTALEGAGRPVLVDAIRSRFKAALIDEFQDTDPLQYAIFSACFSNGTIPFFLIGDPKQAIYSFRGADMYTFLSAEANTAGSNRHTLLVNHRSGSRLVHAINTIFSGRELPFLNDKIPFEKAKTPLEQPHDCRITLNNKEQPPCIISYFPSSGFSHRRNEDSPFAPISLDKAVPALCQSVSSQIAALITHGLIKRPVPDETDKKIEPEDIAILVRTRYQAREMKDALAEAGIPAVLYNAGNVFDSQEAREIHQILHAIVFNHSHTAIHAALCTSLIGLSAEELFKSLQDESLIERYYDEFKEYHALWLRSGFITMFTALLRKQQVRRKLLLLLQGERRLTNVLHIQDLLLQQSIEKASSPSQLLQWLATQINPDTPRDEEHELRLESDSNAVTIVTIHKAKGLQYPIVFCPFAWSSSTLSDDPILFHDEQYRRIYDIGSQSFAEHKQQAQKELLSENIRLFYVALTRARYQCHVFWGRFNQSETSAPAYLFHGPEQWNNTSTITELGAFVTSLTDEQMLVDLRKTADKSDGAIAVREITDIPQVSYVPAPITETKLSCRTFHGTIKTMRQISSFSALVHRTLEYSEQPDRDYFLQRPSFTPVSDSAVIAGERNIFTFPKGAKAGNLLHDILEQFDFTSIEAEKKGALILQALERHAFDAAWLPTVSSLLENLRKKILYAPGPGFSLSSIPVSHTFRELEFYYPVHALQKDTLRSLLSHRSGALAGEQIPHIMESLSFQTVNGFMHGFIDLVFMHDGKYYVVDWKSNHLGNTIDCYTDPFLKKEMTDKFYFLQYHIYALAVHKYLSLRMSDYSYEHNFGGVFYIFLRGISEDSRVKSGIFFDRPEFGIIERMDKELIRT